jgi:CRISPR/Cas system-associated exonuclease Cas4 (RecB family)
LEETMTIEETITRELSCAMQAERFLHPRDHSLLHASAIGSCRRKQGFELMGTEGETQDSHFLSICDIGHGVHGMIQNRLVNVLGWCKQENIELPVRSDEFGIMGHVDALSEPLRWTIFNERPEAWDKLTNTPGGFFETHDGDVHRIFPRSDTGLCNNQPRYIIDIKTITSRPYLKRHPETGVLSHDEPSSFERLQQPKKDHLLQVNLYAWMVKEMGLVEEVPRIMLIYIGKDVESASYGECEDRLLSLPYKVYVRDAEQAYVDEALKRAKHIWTRIKAGELPGKDHWHKPESPAWQCEVCPYRKTCYAEEGYFQDQAALISPSSLAIIESYRR